MRTKHGEFCTVAAILSFVTTDSSGSQDIVSYEKQSDLQNRGISMDDKDTDSESRQTTSDAVPLSPFPDGGWQAWSVLLGVYVFFLFMVSFYS